MVDSLVTLGRVDVAFKPLEWEDVIKVLKKTDDYIKRMKSKPKKRSGNIQLKDDPPDPDGRR
jgi:hypothetical protein